MNFIHITKWIYIIDLLMTHLSSSLIYVLYWYYFICFSTFSSSMIFKKPREIHFVNNILLNNYKKEFKDLLG